MKGTVVLVLASLMIALVAAASTLPDGGTGAPAAVEGVDAAPAPSRLVKTPTFAAPVEVAGPLNTGEPGIAVDGDGRIFVVAPESTTRVWRSLDDGLSFHEVARSLGRSGDSDIAIDDAGTVYVNDLFDQVPVSTSLDHGVTYARVLDAAPSAEFPDRQWLAADGVGTVYATWHNFTENEYRISISHDSARTWAHEEALIAEGFSVAGPLVVAPDGSLHALLSVQGGVDHVRSDDGGLTWTRSTVARNPGTRTVEIFPVVAVDAAGNVYAAWGESDVVTEVTPPSRNPRIMVAASRDGGATFGAPVQISTPGHHGIFPWILAGSEGRVDVFWLEGVPLLPAGVGDPTIGEGHQWYLRMAQSLDAHRPAPHYESVLVSPDAVHVGSMCSGSCFISVGGAGLPRGVPGTFADRRLLDFFEATLDEDGNALVTWAQDPDPTEPDYVGADTYVMFAKQVGGSRLY